VLDLIPEHGFQDIKENLIPRLHRAGARVMAYESEGVCPRVLNAQTYLAVNQWVLERRVREEGESEGLVHPTAWVEPGARLVGPVQLGPRVRVQSGATIVGPTSIGAESTVGRNAWSRGRWCGVAARSGRAR
jgi:NDP-sugar pyrophosphorylase family protein